MPTPRAWRPTRGSRGPGCSLCLLRASRGSGCREPRRALGPLSSPPPLNIHRFLPLGRAGRLPCSTAPRRPLAVAPAPRELAAGGEWAVAGPVHALASPLPRPEEAPPPCPPSPPTFLGLGTRDAAPQFQSH